MTHQPPRLNRDKARIIARGAEDARRHRRIPLAIDGRFAIGGREIHDCQLAEASPGGGRIIADAAPRPGERLLLEVDGFGRLDAEVVRRTESGFSVRWVAGPRRRERLAELLTWRFNAALMDTDQDRIAPRDRRDGMATLELEDGQSLRVRVVDVSATGMLFRSEDRPAVGTRARLGKLSGQIARHHDKGFALQLDPPAKADEAQDPETDARGNAG